MNKLMWTYVIFLLLLIAGCTYEREMVSQEKYKEEAKRVTPNYDFHKLSESELKNFEIIQPDEFLKANFNLYSTVYNLWRLRGVPVDIISSDGEYSSAGYTVCNITTNKKIDECLQGVTYQATGNGGGDRDKIINDLQLISFKLTNHCTRENSILCLSRDISIKIYKPKTKKAVEIYCGRYDTTASKTEYRLPETQFYVEKTKNGENEFLDNLRFNQLAKIYVNQDKVFITSPRKLCNDLPEGGQKCEYIPEIYVLEI